MIYSFDDFRLNTDTEQLTRGNDAIALEPRAFGLLLLLIQHRHRIVTKEEVVEHLRQAFPHCSAISEPADG